MDAAAARPLGGEGCFLQYRREGRCMRPACPLSHEPSRGRVQKQALHHCENPVGRRAFPLSPIPTPQILWDLLSNQECPVLSGFWVNVTSHKLISSRSSKDCLWVV